MANDPALFFDEAAQFSCQLVGGHGFVDLDRANKKAVFASAAAFTSNDPNSRLLKLGALIENDRLFVSQLLGKFAADEGFLKGVHGVRW